VIRYTVDGRQPSWDSPIYHQPVSVEETTTIRAKAWAEDRSDSTVTIADYALDLGRALMPRLNPAPGRYPTAREVNVTCPTAGSTVHYTLSGIDPGETDPDVACGSTITVSRSVMVKARAWKTGLERAPYGWVTRDHRHARRRRISAWRSTHRPGVAWG
jgi:hypothetical protein